MGTRHSPSLVFRCLFEVGEPLTTEQFQSSTVPGKVSCLLVRPVGSERVAWHGRETSKTVRLAVIPGDGIGPEVVAATVPTLPGRAGVAEGHRLDVTEPDWGGERFLREGAAMPADAADLVKQAPDAVLFSAVGRPDVPEHELIWGLIIGLRQQLDLAVNIRPVRAFPGVPTKVRDTDGVDLVIVRENTEGEYVGAGGVAHAGSGHDLGIEVAVHPRRAIERAAHQAFALAGRRIGPPVPGDQVQRDAPRLSAVGPA